MAEVFSRTAIVDLIPTTIADLLRAEHNFLYYLPSLVNAKQIGSAALAILEAVTSIHRADELHAEFCKKLVTERFSRLDFDDRGEVSRLYPFTRASRVNSPKLVVIDPRRRTGRPVLDSCGVPTEMLFERHQAGDSVRELADDYEVNVAEVEEALRYESQQIADTSPPPRGMGD